MKRQVKQKPKKKLKVTGLLLLILIIFILISTFYYAFTRPIKNIIIEGNILLEESNILDVVNIDTSKSFIHTNKSSIKKKTESIPLVDTATITKNIFKGTITISVKENKILFYNSITKKYVLSDESDIADKNYLGIPTLVNYVPQDNYEKFINQFKNVDTNIISMISEIEYSPDKYGDTITDQDRFLFRMNDGNTVYVNIINIKKINKYIDIYSVIDSKGILYLDSSSKNYVFRKYTDEK